jgi:monoamine oxidase
MENEFISAGGKILFEHAVKSVDWSGNNIRVELNSRQPFIVDKLIVSLPAPMLRQTGHNNQELRFIPSSEHQLELFGEIGYGTVVKLVIVWKTAFWRNNFPDAQFIFSSGFIPTWWTQYPLDNPVLTGWLGGPPAEKFSEQPDEFFLMKGFETLSSVFSIAIPELKNELAGFRVFNWKNEIWSRGAYSYPTVQSRHAKISAMKSWGQKIYFAGEAFYEGAHPGTVEAALVSGVDRARQLLAEM